MALRAATTRQALGELGITNVGPALRCDVHDFFGFKCRSRDAYRTGSMRRERYSGGRRELFETMRRVAECGKGPRAAIEGGLFDLTRIMHQGWRV